MRLAFVKQRAVAVAMSCCYPLAACKSWMFQTRSWTMQALVLLLGPSLADDEPVYAQARQQQ